MTPLTTALFIEIFVIGTVADIWLILLILAIVSPGTVLNVDTIDALSKLSSFLVVPFFALTYIMGWVTNFLSENTIEQLFQVRFRKRFFSDAKVDYDNVRPTFFQSASESVIADLNFDRQVLRISRTSVLNFTLIAIALLLYIAVTAYTAIVIVGVTLSSLLAVLSFLQWTNQYKSSYKKMLNTYLILCNKTDQVEQAA